jgi:hypothetical protein
MIESQIHTTLVIHTFVVQFLVETQVLVLVIVIQSLMFVIQIHI